MSHLIYEGIVEVSNLGTEFNTSVNPIVLNLDPTISKLPSGALKANVTSSLSGSTLTMNGTPIDLGPAIKAGETLTVMAYDPALKKISYTAENGAVAVIDLSSLATDVYITGASLDAATMVLTLTDNSATTPDIVLNLAELKKVATSNTGSVSFTGTGEASSPLVANVTSIPAGVALPAANLTGTIPAAIMTTSTTNAIAWTKAAGATNTTNGVAANLAIPTAVIADILGYSAAGEPVWESKAALAATLSIGAAQIGAGALGAGVTIPASQVTGQTNTLAITKADGAVNTTNGVVATQAIPVGTAIDLIGYNAAGTPVNQTVASLPIAPSQLTAGALPATVTVSTASLPATTNTLAVTGPDLVSTVNGVAASVPMASIVPATTNTLTAIPVGAGPNAQSGAGNITSTVNGVIATVASPAPVEAKLFANYGASSAMPSAVTNLGGGNNISYLKLATLAAAGTVTLPPIAGYPKLTELHVKAVGTWVGAMNVASADLIDGLATYPVAKTATRQPSITVMHNGTTWFVV